MKTRILNTILTSILLFISLATINAQVTTVTLNPSQDAIIISNQVNGDPASEYFSCGIGKTGRIDPRTGQLITTTFEIRSLMLFDLSDIPANAIILSANLSLYSTGHGITTPGAYLQPVIQPWTQLDVSWSNQPEAVGTGQVFLGPTAEPSQDYTLDVSFFVDLWIKGVENDGFMFRIGEGYLNTCSYNFASSDYPDNTMFPKLEVSWVMPIELSFNVTDGSAEGTKSITTTITGGVPPYSVEWDSGERMPNLGNTQSGIHIIYVSDATGEEKIFSISTMENYPVVWSDLVNTVVDGDVLNAVDTGNPEDYYGAASINKIAANTDGGVKYSFAHVQGADFISSLSIGLSEINTDASDMTIEYSFRLSSVSNRYLPAFGLPAKPSARIFESGIWVEGTEIPLNEGAVYEITRTGNTINYIINSIVVHQTTTDPNKSLIADVSLLNPNNWIAGVEMYGTIDLRPANDKKSNAFNLVNTHAWSSDLAFYSNLYATPDENMASCWNDGPNNNCWFKFQSTTGEITIGLKTGLEEGTIRFPKIALTDATGNEIACSKYTSEYSDLEIWSNSLIIGEQYYINIDNENGDNNSGTFSLFIHDGPVAKFKNGELNFSEIDETGIISIELNFASNRETIIGWEIIKNSAIPFIDFFLPHEFGDVIIPSGAIVGNLSVNILKNLLRTENRYIDFWILNNETKKLYELNICRLNIVNN